MLISRRRHLRLAISTAFAAVVAVGLLPANAMANENAADANALVTSTVVNADGTVTETIYTPARGVSPAQLSQSLRSRGVANVALTPSTTASADVASCTNGTARTWASNTTCFVRWSYNGAVRPILDFFDHSSAGWPVGRAVTKWNETSGIDSIYRSLDAGCDGGPAHCVFVYSANYGSNGEAGKTSRTFNAAHTYYASADVYLNDYYAGNETDRWASACHELGHVLGLDHNTSKSSCLYYAQAAGVSKYPNTDDFNLLERYY